MDWRERTRFHRLNLELQSHWFRWHYCTCTSTCISIVRMRRLGVLILMIRGWSKCCLRKVCYNYILNRSSLWLSSSISIRLFCVVSSHSRRFSVRQYFTCPVHFAWYYANKSETWPVQKRWPIWPPIVCLITCLRTHTYRTPRLDTCYLLLIYLYTSIIVMVPNKLSWHVAKILKKMCLMQKVFSDSYNKPVLCT